MVLCLEIGNEVKDKRSNFGHTNTEICVKQLKAVNK